MTKIALAPRKFIGASTDDKPSGAEVPLGSTFFEHDTHAMYITYDDGTNWVLKDQTGEVKTSPTANTVLARLKALEGYLAGLGYEFTINGVNFDGYEKIKILTLDADAEDDDPQPLNFEGSPYKVPGTKVFIVFQALVKLQQTDLIGRIGEAESSGGVISKEVLKLSNGTNLPFMTNCWGVFTADKYITAETNSSNDNYQIMSGSALYGVEVDA